MSSDSQAHELSVTLGNRSFSAFIGTQFLGAFNDNVFKQVLLLIAASLAAAKASEGGGIDMQGLVAAVFTLPFLLFSGYAGQLSEILSKTRIMVLAKWAELLIMILGGIGFYLDSLPFLLVVLFLMGVQSAFFGPSKYGIIPEIIDNRSLVAANGVVQMTTIGAITLGTALGGFLRDQFDGAIYLTSIACAGISVLGIGCVMLIKPRVPNRPEMKFSWNPAGRLLQSGRHLVSDPPLLLALIASAFFFASGAVVTFLINAYGLRLLGLNNTNTSLLLVVLTVGIAVGSLLASPIRRKLNTKGAVVLGAVGVIVVESSLFFYQMPLIMINILLFLAGIMTAIYYVPVAAFLQSRPAMGKKGEILAAVSFSNFAGIMVSAGIWQALMALGMPVQYMWLIIAAGLVILLTVMYPKLHHLND